MGTTSRSAAIGARRRLAVKGPTDPIVVTLAGKTVGVFMPVKPLEAFSSGGRSATKLRYRSRS